MIVVDWGTTAFRAYRVAPDGTVLDRVATQEGILAAEGRFAEILAARTGGWPGPCRLVGMVGSRQGWREAPYVETPAAASDLAAATLGVEGGLILPGVLHRHEDGRPDVMRGEETQALGAAAHGRNALVILPGTHSKWVAVESGRIVWLATFMTGETFAVMAKHSILGRLFADGDGADGFAQGLEAAKSGALLHRLFAARTRGLADAVDGATLRGYLSGLLIGSEIEDAVRMAGRWLDGEVCLVGAPDLVPLYTTAFLAAGLPAPRQITPETATIQGALAIAGADDSGRASG